MLNPESVDYNQRIVRILFTDENCYEAVKIYLSETDAWRLHEMIQRQLNFVDKERLRGVNSEKFDPTF